MKSLEKLKIVKVRRFCKFQMFMYCLFHSDVNIIVNNKTKSMKFFENAIDLEFVLNLFFPILYGDQNIITITLRDNQYSSFSKILTYVLKTDNQKEYRLDYRMNKYNPTENYYQLTLVYKIGVEKVIFNGSYFGFQNNEPESMRVLNKHILLGFEPAQKINIPIPLCMSCNFFTGNNHVRCAVNPYQITTTCFDCNDYELNKSKTFDIEDYI